MRLRVSAPGATILKHTTSMAYPYRVGMFVIVLSCVIGCATSAEAECAWVLWSQTSTFGKQPRGSVGDWVVQGAHASMKACEQTKELQLTTLVKHGATRGTDPLLTDSATRKDAALDTTFFSRFMCLPDTVDPRAPKAR